MSRPDLLLYLLPARHNRKGQTTMKKLRSLKWALPIAATLTFLTATPSHAILSFHEQCNMPRAKDTFWWVNWLKYDFKDGKFRIRPNYIDVDCPPGLGRCADIARLNVKFLAQTGGGPIIDLGTTRATRVSGGPKEGRYRITTGGPGGIKKAPRGANVAVYATQIKRGNPNHTCSDIFYSTDVIYIRGARTFITTMPVRDRGPILP